MNYEQKYKDALGWMKSIYPTMKGGDKEDAEHYFPELKESEDERIRLDIITTLSIGVSCEESVLHPGAHTTLKEALTWLEKKGEKKAKYHDVCDKCTRQPTCQSDCFLQQCEQKPTDKVEPKFHVGEWVVTDKNNVVQIKATEDSKYVLENTMRFSVEYVDKCWRKWTIQDAKDGDVLTCYSDIKGQPIEQTGIIKQYVGRHGGCSNSLKVHFGVDWDNNVVIEGYMGSSNIYPSTKEQRDQLEKAMADAGYTFDFEKKELKKIEQKPAWSEEDNIMVHDIDYALRCQITYPKSRLDSMSSWIYNLKDRVQPKQEWSEEDKRNLFNVKCIIDGVWHNQYVREEIEHSGEELESLWHWLDNLWQRVEYPQNTWKPSDEQIEAIKDAIEFLGCTKKVREDLKSLYEQLKKLREE